MGIMNENIELDDVEILYKNGSKDEDEPNDDEELNDDDDDEEPNDDDDEEPNDDDEQNDDEEPNDDDDGDDEPKLKDSFKKIVKDFITDLLGTFPELYDILDNNLKNIYN